MQQWLHLGCQDSRSARPYMQPWYHAFPATRSLHTTRTYTPPYVHIEGVGRQHTSRSPPALHPHWFRAEQ